MNGAVVLDRVSFTYPDAADPALAEVTLAVPEGCFALVAGATGSGKSTLIRTMNGLVPHFTGGRFSGRALVAGRDTLEHAPRALADVVAFVPQDPQASFVLDRVEDELAYALENLAVTPSAMRRRVEETLDLLHIEELRDRSVRSLSGGERQRVAIAAAMTTGARVLLLDEPTSQLDPLGAEDVLAALHRLVHDLGVTVVLAEHRVERVAGFVDLALGCVGDGVVKSGPPRAILDLVDAVPPVARLGRLAGWSPLPLTVREARRYAGTGSLRPPDGGRSSHRRAPGSALVEARGLSAGYGERTALRGVDLCLESGEIVVLMGRNGAGKTTLLRCLTGLHEPSSGSVIAGEAAPRPGRDVALCPQFPDTILFRDRVLDEVSTTLRAVASTADPHVLLAAFDITRLADEHPRDLSAGQRVLVATAAMAATGAPVLLLDEPTRGLDPAVKSRLVGFLRERARHGAAVMVATHDVELAAELATRIVMLAGGEVIADGEPWEVIGDSAVFAPQTARVFGPRWLTPASVAAALGAQR